MADLISRRAAAVRIFGAAALTIAPVAVALALPDNPDAEIIALGAEIGRRAAEAARFDAEHIGPHEARFDESLDDETRPFEARWSDAWAFSAEVGRTAAIDALGELEQATDELFDRMMAIPATTQAGRAAKVQALLVHVLREKWRGPAGPLDYEKGQVQALLGEFAGLSAAELEAT